MIGTILDGKYRVTRILGAGAMGSVYEAEHTATGRRVAIKVISSGDLTRDEMIVTRFQREARAAGAIDTQHITQVLDAGRDRDTGLPFLVMEFLSGEDFSQLLKRTGPIAPELALRIVAQACLGLQKAHEAGVVHRDMKPANLFLARRDAGEMIVKLLDFGIAKVAMEQAQGTDDAGLTKTGSMLGSPLYMSPEQARGSRDIDHRTDIWSLGVVLYQALSGRTPYQHCTALGELIIAICSEFPPNVQDLAPWVPPEVAAIVHRAIRHNPDERFQSASDMFQAIKRLLPYGWSLSEDMLVSMQEAERAQPAARFALTNALSGASTNPGGTPTAPAQHDGTAAASALTQSQPAVQAQPAPSSKIGIIAGAAALSIAAATGVYFAARPHAPPPVTTQAVQTAAPPPTATATVAAAPPPTATATAATTVEAAPRRVKVVIMPSDASVEVEGTPTPIKNGLLEITGTPGSVHRVRIFKGKREYTTDVIVTESGPSPPKVEIPAVTAPGKAAPSGAPAAGGSPAAPKGIIDKFE